MGIAEVEDQPENGPRGLLGLALVEVTAMGSIQQSVCLLILAEQMSRDRIALQVLGG